MAVATEALLLDTHVFLWWRAEPDRISIETRDLVSEADQVWVSVVSAWEAAIKISLGRLALPEPFEVGVEKSELAKLPLTFGHCEQLLELPRQHRDPFDRMLVVQARCESLMLVTADQQLEAYDVPILRA